MSDVSEELVSVAFLGKRVAITRALTDNFNCVVLRVTHLQLDELTFGGRLDKFPLDFEGGTGSLL